MGFWELFLLALALSADAFAVSVTNGFCMKKIVIKKTFVIALSFGVFQMIMPIIGFFLSVKYTEKIAQWDHYIAFILLGIIGVKMLIEGIRELKSPEDNEQICTTYDKKLSPAKLFVQSIATSIDALIVGISFAAMKVNIVAAAAFIGFVTFFLGVMGVFLGKKSGDVLGSKAEVIGGFILFGIGLKIFIQHTFFGG